MNINDVGVGRVIRDCVATVNSWQSGGNTLLGTIILLVPIAFAAGATSQKDDNAFDIADLRRNLRMVVESTTPEDAVSLYEAIRIAKPAGLGIASELDVNNPRSVDRILAEKISAFPGVLK